MAKLIDVTKYPVIDVLHILLQDKTTNKNIIWATDAYKNFDEKSEMTVNAILNNPDIICPRVFKSKAEQIVRSRKKAEVFTPAWLVNKMNNFLDEDWFDRKKDWKNYIDSRRLEITCGEAPFLVSRYDATTGDIIPIENRVGILDRKMKVIGENLTAEYEWAEWAFRAFESVYGYEYQGDNLLIARINLLMSFVEYFEQRFGREPQHRYLKRLAGKIAWNIWQMDGLDNLNKEDNNISLFDNYEEKNTEIVTSKIFNWRSKFSFKFADLKKGIVMKKKLFDYVIIGTSLIGTTQTFISVGAFDTEEEAKACLKYIKTKFARTMLGTLKITQHNPPATWRNVPLQDFTQNSDIDWTKSIVEIDRQLYKKYGLSDDEVQFIESHVKEMM